MKRIFKGFLILRSLFFTTIVYAAVGDLVSTFGTDGVVVTNFGIGSATDTAWAVVKDSSGNVIMVGDVNDPLTAKDFAVIRLTSAGALDTTFGTDGIVTTDSGFYGNDTAYTVAVDSSGNIVVVGQMTDEDGNYNAAIVRYDSSGNLDTTFGGDGLVTLDTGGTQEYFVDVAFDSSGNIVLAGRSDNVSSWSEYEFLVARLNSSGDLDTSFGDSGSGYTILDLGTVGYSNYIYDLMLDNTGRPIVAGCLICDDSNSDSVLVRLDTTGALDTTFGGGDGVYSVDITGSSLKDVAYKITKDSSGKVIMVGKSDSGTSDDFYVARVKFTGVPDLTFGTTGVVTTDFGSSADETAVNVSCNATYGITVLGYSGTSGSYAFLAARYTSAGVLDTSFDGGDGLMSTTVSGLTGGAFGYSNATAFKGTSYYVVGTDSSGQDFTITLLDSSLTPSTSFGTSGVTTVDVPVSSFESIASLAQNSSGNIYAAGGQVEQGNTAGEYDFALARYTSTGVLDTTFGDGDGLVVTTLVSSAMDVAQEVLVDSSDRPILVGYADNTSSDDFVVVRYDTSGNLDTTFSGDGIVMTDFGSFDDKAYAAVLDGSGNILVGGTSYTSSSYSDFALAKYDSSGNLDTTFGGGDVPLFC